MDVLGHGKEEVLCTNTPNPRHGSIRESLLAIATRLVSIGKKSAWAVFVKHHRLMEHLGGESIANDQVLSCAETFVYNLTIQSL